MRRPRFLQSSRKKLVISARATKKEKTDTKNPNVKNLNSEGGLGEIPQVELSALLVYGPRTTYTPTNRQTHAYGACKIKQKLPKLRVTPNVTL